MAHIEKRYNSKGKVIPTTSTSDRRCKAAQSKESKVERPCSFCGLHIESADCDRAVLVLYDISERIRKCFSDTGLKIRADCGIIGNVSYVRGCSHKTEFIMENDSHGIKNT